MKKVTIESLFGLRFVSNPGFSPDGKYAAFIVKDTDLDNNKYNSDLWIFERETKAYYQLTNRKDIKNYFWKKDGSLFLTVEKNRHTYIYEISLTGGEAIEKYEIPFSVTEMKEQEDGSWIISGIWDNSPDKGQEVEVIEEAPFWFNGSGFTYGQRQRIFWFYPDKEKEEQIVPITGEWFEVGQWRQLGDWLLVSGMEWTTRKYNWNEVCMIHLKDASKKVLIERDTIRTGDVLEFINEKEALISVADHSQYGWYQYPEFFKMDLETAKLTKFAFIETPIGTNAVNSDARLGAGKLIRNKKDGYWFVTSVDDESGVCRLNEDGTIDSFVEKGAAVDGFDVFEGHILECAMKENRADELYYDGVRVTDFNGEWFANRQIANPEPVVYTGKDGFEIHGWVLPPNGIIEREKGRKFPAILHIHGGPRTSFGTIWHHEMQMWAAAGYFVMYCNPRGSDGRGNEFADIREQYGSVEYENIMEFTDEVLKRYPEIDQTRVGVTGGSYGGFMTNWIIGHTNRFAAAASQRSIANWLSCEYTSDIGYIFNKRHHDTYTRENPEKLWDCSPLKYADKCVTPTLFIHADQDFRCWMGEGLSMYGALKLNGCPARMCLFKGESHELSRSGKPHNRIRRMQEILRWMDHYLKGER